MPKSRVRRKAVYTPPPRPKKVQPSPAWLAPTMVALWFVGIAWIAVYYITTGDLPLLDRLGDWNLLVGFGFIIAGFVLSTRWR
ncbi:MAG: cell division protein CrgA [Streptosporangiaceae bacterium]